MKIEGYISYHEEPMIFPAKICETLDSEKGNSNETVFYVFGGEDKFNMKFKKSKKSDEGCVLKELVIEWDANTGRPKRVFMRQQAFAERGPVKFLGNPSFDQNMVNKKYFPK